MSCIQITIIIIKIATAILKKIFFLPLVITRERIRRSMTNNWLSITQALLGVINSRRSNSKIGNSQFRTTLVQLIIV